MRAIKTGEPCLTAAEIAERFRAETGADLHPTNVGNAAKKLGLDYLESYTGDGWHCRRYAEADLPLIFTKLQALVDHRQKFATTKVPQVEDRKHG